MQRHGNMCVFPEHLEFSFSFLSTYPQKIFVKMLGYVFEYKPVWHLPTCRTLNICVFVCMALYTYVDHRISDEGCAWSETVSAPLKCSNTKQPSQLQFSSYSFLGTQGLRANLLVIIQINKCDIQTINQVQPIIIIRVFPMEENVMAKKWVQENKI